MQAGKDVRMKNEEFINRLAEDITKIETMFPGLRREQILRMISALEYVQRHVLLPQYCRLETKLPKGYKKKDGIPVKMADYYPRYKPVIVECGDDLYMNHVVYGKPKNYEMWLVIEGYKSIPPLKWINDFERVSGGWFPTEIQDVILKVCKERGVRIGSTIPILRDMKVSGEP